MLVQHKYCPLSTTTFSFYFASVSILLQWLVVIFFVSWNHISLFLYCREKRYSENIFKLFSNGSNIFLQYVNTIILWPWAYIGFSLEIILVLSPLFNSILDNYPLVQQSRKGKLTSVVNYRRRTALKKGSQKLRFFLHVNNRLCSNIAKTQLMISRIYNLLM